MQQWTIFLKFHLFLQRLVERGEFKELLFLSLTQISFIVSALAFYSEFLINTIALSYVVIISHVD